MKKRIYSSIILLIIPCVIILATLLSLLFHNAAKKQELAAIRDYTRLLSDLLNNGLYGDFIFSDYISLSSDVTRMTIIAPDGAVILDSKTTADSMENHATRPEIISALQTGTGESLRFSGTLRTETYYYAVRLNDGYILRLSRPVGSIAATFMLSLPAAAAVTALILAAAGFTARRLTEHIMAPLSNIGFKGDNGPVYDELLPYVNKIDRQKREIDEKIAELSNRAETIETITGNMNEGLILIDGKAAVLTANKSARDIFGGHIENRNILHIYRDMDFHHTVDRCLSGENSEIVMERAGRVFNVSLSPVQSDTEVRGAVVLFRDTTELHLAEKQRREFSANVSHELKTPLTTITALSEMIENGIAKEADISIFAARITEQSGRLLALIDDIIRLSEFDEGGVAKDSTVFDLRELAETVIGAFRGSAGSVGILLTGEHFNISANRRMIDELLYNLIDNGIKYNKDGGSVTVALSREEDGACSIAVSDTGIGIPSQYQPRVFERFFRVDKSRSKKTGGTGLGLSIVKHIAEYHGGRVVLQSVEGAGTTVTCYINHI